jgi:putative transcriptional regulator
MIEYKLVSPGPGKLLIAEPFMGDNNFKRSVVLITAHEPDGVVGFILNRPSDFTVDELMPDFSNVLGFSPRVYVGGPVQPDTLHFIHKLGNVLEGSMKIAPGIWWGGNAQQLSEMIKNNEVTENDIRFFMGYSGWGAAQLDLEIDEKSWIVTNSFESLIFDSESENGFWRKIVKQLGGNYTQMANYPEDIHWN